MVERPEPRPMEIQSASQRRRRRKAYGICSVEVRLEAPRKIPRNYAKPSRNSEKALSQKATQYAS